MQMTRTVYTMERITVNILGELPETEEGNRYILVIVDYLTKWMKCFQMKNMSSETVMKTIVEKIVARFGIPSKIHSNQGSQFEGKLFHDMRRLLG